MEHRGIPANLDLFHAMPARQGVMVLAKGCLVSMVVHAGRPVVGVAVAQLVAQTQAGCPSAIALLWPTMQQQQTWIRGLFPIRSVHTRNRPFGVSTGIIRTSPEMLSERPLLSGSSLTVPHRHARQGPWKPSQQSMSMRRRAWG